MEIEENTYLKEIEELTEDQIRNWIRIFEENIWVMKSQETQV